MTTNDEIKLTNEAFSIVFSQFVKSSFGSENVDEKLAVQKAFDKYPSVENTDKNFEKILKIIKNTGTDADFKFRWIN
jgi:hypothetical protein|tara:strand:- start:109 stop:339 length:231 start_codon:yes stop_codon:yes gene_type:complete